MSLRRPPTDFPRVDWDDLHSHIQHTWRQGEHFAIVGPTGCGKTTFESRILPVRQYVVVLVTKVEDATISQDFKGFHRISKWPPKFHQDKVLLWPKAGKTIRDTLRIQHDTFQHALNKIFLEKNWCVVFDEQHYVCKKLRLEDENAMIQHQGRSSGLSVVNGTQRPAWVPVVTYSSASHAAIWNTNYRDDLRRLADLGGINARDLADNIQRLGRHEFVYINTRTGDAMKSQVRR